MFFLLSIMHCKEFSPGSVDQCIWSSVQYFPGYKSKGCVLEGLNIFFEEHTVPMGVAKDVYMLV